MTRLAKGVRVIERRSARLKKELGEARRLLSAQTQRADHCLGLLERHRAVLLAVRSHFGRDRFHALLPEELRKLVIGEIGDGIQ